MPATPVRVSACTPCCVRGASRGRHFCCSLPVAFQMGAIVLGQLWSVPASIPWRPLPSSSAGGGCQVPHPYPASQRRDCTSQCADRPGTARLVSTVVWQGWQGAPSLPGGALHVAATHMGPLHAPVCLQHTPCPEAASNVARHLCLILLLIAGVRALDAVQLLQQAQLHPGR